MLVNPVSQKWIDGYIAAPKSAVCIYAQNDDESTIKVIEHIYDSLKDANSQPLMILDFEDKTSIGIDDVRSMQKQLQLSANTSQSVSRIIALRRAERLTVQAQNALLKLIEELPQRTITALLTTDKSTILPTIFSRCFMLELLPITLEQALGLGKEHGISDAEVKKLLMLSEGRASIFTEMVVSGESKIEPYIADAKEFLSASVFDRQKLTVKIVDKKYDAALFIMAMKVTAKSAMRHAVNGQSRARWKNALKVVLEVEKMLSQKVQTKLALLYMSVNLK